MWDKEKLLLTSSFFFSHSVFNSFWKSLNFVVRERVNSLPNDKNLDLSKLKAFADNKIIVNKKLKFASGTVENIVGKEENAGYQHFLFFLQLLRMTTPSGMAASRFKYNT